MPIVIAIRQFLLPLARIAAKSAAASICSIISGQSRKKPRDWSGVPIWAVRHDQ